MRALYQQYRIVKSLLDKYENQQLTNKSGTTPRIALTRAQGKQIDAVLTYSSLKTEKKKLQIFLHEYQNEFIQAHGRKVSTREDRLPVQSQYDRYKVSF